MEIIQDLMNLILWDRRLVLLPEYINYTTKTFIILNPTVTDRNFAMFEKCLVMQQAISTGTPTEVQLLSDAREGEDWTDQDDLILKESENHIVFLESEKDRQKSLTKRNRIEDQIKDTKQKLQIVLDKKQHMYSLTAEYMAHEAAVFVIMRRTILDEYGQLFFNNSNTISSLSHQNKDLLNFLIHQVLSEGFLGHAEIRKVARSLEWRMIWTLNRENIRGLFNTSIANLSSNQRMLIYWSRVYDLAYESTEKPDDDIVQDDKKFDIWLKNRSNEKSEIKANEKRGAPNHHEHGIVLDGYYIDKCNCDVGVQKIKGHGERPRHANTCLYGTYKRYTREEKNKIADEIYGRNSKSIQQIQVSEQNTVAKMGLIDEKDLINKKTRLILGSKQEVRRIRK